VTPYVPLKDGSKSGFDTTASEEGAERITGTTGISSRLPSRRLPIQLALTELAPLRRVAPPRTSSDSSVSSLRLTRGFRGAGRALGCPSAWPTRVALFRACPGTAPLHLRVGSRHSRFAWSGRHLRDVFPTVRLASLGARGSRTGGVSARWPSPEPSWPRDPPDLHGHSTG